MFKKIDKAIDLLVEYLLVAIVMTVMILGVLVIVLRWFSVNLQWIEPLTRHLVFLSAFLGGVVATKKGTHIGIDVLGKYLESKNKHVLLVNIQRYIAMVSCLTLVWLSYGSYQFYLTEKEFAAEAFLGLSTPTLVAIIPVGFLLIAYRFLVVFIESFYRKVN